MIPFSLSSKRCGKQISKILSFFQLPNGSDSQRRLGQSMAARPDDRHTAPYATNCDAQVPEAIPGFGLPSLGRTN